ncbi:hypothetical protein HGT73_09490 [Rosenbergiella australiborealis]|uniref:Uncharacterized protein n=1 Tax=Rosenbergiella australiborealis TaxID=1544696 RepID=A0ABS5T5I4_9GAMM|nr:hypothetical protein [Rosenbergiella australiborealis]MBT0727614.1 hypothetical protein [Rosenbergiella australiborealis]
MHASFVSLGQLLKFAYDATGVLPRKRAERTGRNEKDIKRISKQLERLIDEEGCLMARSKELIRVLYSELAGTIQNPKVSVAIRESINDLFDVYHNVVCNEVTYLSPKDSLKRFYGAHAIPELVLSIQKHILRLNIAAEEFIAPPENDWYLPDISENSTIIWPLDKAMNWIYIHCQTNRTQFHSAGMVIHEDDPEIRQNIENASNWQSGATFPSWHGLHWNFSRSMDRLVAAEGAYQRAISAKEKESILYVLFLARLSTYVSKQLKEAYGEKFLSEMLQLFKRQRNWLVADLQTFKAQTDNFIEQHAIPEEQHNSVWFKLSNRHWSWFTDQCRHCGATMQELIATSEDHVIPETKIAQLCNQYGDYIVRAALDSLVSVSDLHNSFFGFWKAILKGFDLKKSIITTEADVAAYEAEMRDNQLLNGLQWMVHWNRALIHYRKHEDKEAFRHIEKAFEVAQYSAGKNQYEIVNQFIELAAKNNNWKSFKNGVLWANYLGIRGRWLSNYELTDENLRHAFNIMKNTHFRYGI